MSDINLPVNLEIKGFTGLGNLDSSASEILKKALPTNFVKTFESLNGSILNTLKTLDKIGISSDPAQKAIESLNKVLQVAFDETDQKRVISYNNAILTLRKTLDDFVSGKTKSSTADLTAAINQLQTSLQGVVGVSQAGTKLKQVFTSSLVESVSNARKTAEKEFADIGKARKALANNFTSIQNATVKALSKEASEASSLAEVYEKLGDAKRASELRSLSGATKGRATQTEKRDVDSVITTDEKQSRKAIESISKTLENSSQRVSKLIEERTQKESLLNSIIKEGKNLQFEVIAILQRRASALKETLSIAKQIDGFTAEGLEELNKEISQTQVELRKVSSIRVTNADDVKSLQSQKEISQSILDTTLQQVSALGQVKDRQDSLVQSAKEESNARLNQARVDISSFDKTATVNASNEIKKENLQLQFQERIRNKIIDLQEQAAKVSERALTIDRQRSRAVSELERKSNNPIDLIFNIGSAVSQDLNKIINLDPDAAAKKLTDRYFAAIDREVDARTKQAVDSRPEKTFTPKETEALREQFRSEAIASGRFAPAIRDTDSALDGLIKKVDTAKNAVSSYSKTSAETVSQQTKLTNELFKTEKQAISFQIATDKAKFSLERFGDQSALAIKRFGAFLFPTAIFFQLTNSIRAASREALEFEKVFTKVQQVIGGGTGSTGAFDKIAEAIFRASEQTGTTTLEIAGGIQTFAQAGFQDAEQLLKIADTLAKIPLAPTFDGIESTTEGLLAVFGQFNKGLSDTAEILDLINQFSADFAVSSEDLVQGIKRGGSAFSVAGGQLSEFVELFSVLREGSRESSEVLGTFFKSATAQLLRGSSQASLETLGVDTTRGITDQLIQLSDKIFGDDAAVDGKQAVQLVRGLVEQRQFSRLLVLLRQLQNDDVIERIDTARGRVSGSVDRTIGLRVDDIGTSISRVTESFRNFFKELTQNQTLIDFAKLLSDTTTNSLALLRALEPLIPVIAAFAGTAGAIGTKSFFTGFTDRLVRGGVPRVKTSNFDASGDFIFGSNDRLERNLSNRAKQQLLSRGISVTPQSFRDEINTLARTENIVQNRRVLESRNSGVRPSRLSRLGSLARSGVSAIGGRVGTAGFAGALIGGSLQAGGQEQLGQSIQNVSFGAIAGSIFGPFGAALGASISLISEVNKSLERTRLERFSDSLNNAANDVEKLAASLRSISEQGGGTDSFFDVLKLEGKKLLSSIGLSEGLTESELIDSIIGQSKIDKNKILDTILLAALPGSSGFVSSKSIFGNLNDEVSQPELTRLGIVKNVREGTDEGKVVLEVFRNAIDGVVSEIASSISEGSIDGSQIQVTINKLLPRIFEKLLAQAGSSVDNVQLLTGELFDALNIDFKDITRESFVKTLDDEIINLQNAVTNFVAGLTETFEKQSDFSEILDTFILNLSDQITISLPSGNQNLFQFAGIDQFSGFESETKRISDVLLNFVTNFRSGISDVANNLSQEGNASVLDLSEDPFDLFLNTLSENSEIEKEQADELRLVFERLSKESGVGLANVIKDIVESRDIESTVRNLRPDVEIAEENSAQAIRNQIDLLNKEITVRRQLSEAALQANQQIGSLIQQLQSIDQTIRDRRSTTDEFNNNISGTRSQFRVARDLIDSASVSGGDIFGDQSTEAFIKSFRRSQNRTSDAILEQQRIQREGLSGNNSLDNLKIAALESAAAQEEFARKSNDLATRIGFLGGKIEDAARATDIFRSIVLESQETFRSLGASVIGRTTEEYGNQILALRLFGKSLGDFGRFAALSSEEQFKLVDKSFQTLNEEQSALVREALAALQNIDIGGGLTGANILSNFNENLGLNVAAQQIAALTGRPIEEVAKAIKEQRAAAIDEANKAAEKENQLREEQRSLIALQIDVAKQQLEFFKGQENILRDVAGTINSGTGDSASLTDIRNQVSKFFNAGSPQPVVVQQQNRLDKLVSQKITFDQVTRNFDENFAGTASDNFANPQFVGDKDKLLRDLIRGGNAQTESKFVDALSDLLSVGFDPQSLPNFGQNAIPFDDEDYPRYIEALEKFIKNLNSFAGDTNTLDFINKSLDERTNRLIKIMEEQNKKLENLSSEDSAQKSTARVPTSIFVPTGGQSSSTINNLEQSPIPPAKFRAFDDSVSTLADAFAVNSEAMELNNTVSTEIKEMVSRFLPNISEQIVSQSQLLSRLDTLSTISDVLVGISSAINRILSIPFFSGGESSGEITSPTQKVEIATTVAPIQVNVAVSGQDFVNIAKVQIYNEVLSAIKSKLLEAFKFDPEALGRIQEM